MLTIIFLTLAALGGWAVGHRVGYRRGRLFGARYSARRAFQIMRSHEEDAHQRGLNDAADIIIADAKAAMAEAHAAGD